MSIPGPASAPLRPFRLTRHFLSTSLVGTGLVVACLIWVYGHLAERQLVEHETQANTDLTHAFANAVWSRHRGFVVGSPGRKADDLRADPAQAAMRAEVLDKMRDLRVAKVKAYNLDGDTVFSTDPRQVGENKRDNAGFQAARAGRVSSQITFRERFDAFEGEIANRNLISTYLPVYAPGATAPEAVFEVYSDVTHLIAAQRRSMATIVGAVLGALGALWLFQLALVRKADRLLAAHDAERQRREADVRHRAYHDELTGLPNRAQFGQRLGDALAQAARRGRRGAVLFIDLDGFKRVNDRHGHAVGDELLRQVSQRIGACLRTGDGLFRMGGDEFTVLVDEIDRPEDAGHVARRIVSAVARPFTAGGHALHVGASIGIAIYPADGDTVDTLLQRADAAMYRSKEAGRGTCTFHGAVAAPADRVGAAETHPG